MGIKVGVKVEVKVGVKMDSTFVYNIVAKCIVPLTKVHRTFLILFFSIIVT